ncbi:MAG TPA: MerR family transcriptional regulator [Clostridia bacterium]|nr:MerR family transcriptional regulator [Clostridia bacterium]HPK14870.1 MerR family transcriptional regulator [Clostridia bacterium]
MNIRGFADKYNISVMTIRFYIESGLLSPKKEKGKWVFCEEDSQLIEEILTYKNCGFSLESIKQMIGLRQTWAGDEMQRIRAVRSLLLAERARLNQEHSELCEAIRMLERECAPKKEAGDAVNSIPLRLFELIACPYCDKSLEWDRTAISQNAVRQGIGRCGCGFEAKIEDGILFCPEKPIIQSVDTNLETIRKRTARDISTLEKYFLWLFERLNAMDLKNKVMFEDVINLICFTAKTLPLLNTPPDMILSDSLPGAVRYYAAALHAIRPDCGILLIVDDGVHHPLKRGCLDIVLDYCSSEIIQSYGYSSVFSLMRGYLKPNAAVLGRFSYLYKQKGSIGHPSVPANPIRYNLKVLKRSLAENGIHIDEDLVGEEDLVTSVYNGCRPGDIIRPYVFIGHAAVDPASPPPERSLPRFHP